MSTFSFSTNQTEFFADLLEVVHLFFMDAPTEDGATKIHATFLMDKDRVSCRVELNEKVYLETYQIKVAKSQSLIFKRYFKRYIKLALYKALSNYLGVYSPWGSLTGIRPTKLWYDLLKEGGQDIAKIFEQTFLVSPQKTALTEKIVDSQKSLISRDSNIVDLYIGIPFCLSRCHYCSFSSGLVSKWQNRLGEYVSLLIDEIRASQEIIEDKFEKMRAVYIGGGTPSSLPLQEIKRLLSALPKGEYELTVEIGRPDTITKELYDILAEKGVSRISLNPQTLHNKTLQKIGRNHTAEQFLEKFQLAKEYNFIINSDLIAALTEETVEDFRHSVDTLIALNPQNITIHTLALKRGAQMLLDNQSHTSQEKVQEMIEYSQDALKSANYFPYYMYRQKYMAGNLENVGFSKKGQECLYNIDMMEETTSILACGAGAISKKVFSADNMGTRIERAANVKDIDSYFTRSKEMIERKRKLFLG